MGEVLERRRIILTGGFSMVTLMQATSRVLLSYSLTFSILIQIKAIGSPTLSLHMVIFVMLHRLIIFQEHFGAERNFPC